LGLNCPSSYPWDHDVHVNARFDTFSCADGAVVNVRWRARWHWRCNCARARGERRHAIKPRRAPLAKVGKRETMPMTETRKDKKGALYPPAYYGLFLAGLRAFWAEERGPACHGDAGEVHATSLGCARFCASRFNNLLPTVAVAGEPSVTNRQEKGERTTDIGPSPHHTMPRRDAERQCSCWHLHSGLGPGVQVWLGGGTTNHSCRHSLRKRAAVPP